MGGLLQAVQAKNKIKRQSELAHKRDWILGELKALNVTRSQHGQPIDQLDYEELSYELVLASFRVIDTDTESNKWY